jgi:co-chaperonin GroES (HSP10)
MIPTKNHVLIKPEPIADVSNGGIFIGAVPPPVHRNGTVVAVGEDCEMVVPGDKVLYIPRRAVDNEGLHVVNEEDDILYIENKEAATA